MNTEGEWGVVQMLGHQTVAGFVKRLPEGTLLVKVPATAQGPAHEVMVGANAVYMARPSTRADVLATIAEGRCYQPPEVREHQGVAFRAKAVGMVRKTAGWATSDGDLVVCRCADDPERWWAPGIGPSGAPTEAAALDWFLDEHPTGRVPKEDPGATSVVEDYVRDRLGMGSASADDVLQTLKGEWLGEKPSPLRHCKACARSLLGPDALACPECGYPTSDGAYATGRILALADVPEAHRALAKARRDHIYIDDDGTVNDIPF